MAIKKTNLRPERKLKFRENSKRRRVSGQYSKWQKDNPDKIKEYNAKRSDRNHNINQQEWDDCRIYFNFRCAYCDKTWEQNKKESKKDLHKEHVIHNGLNDLSNCVPSCQGCNSRKWEFSFEEWYDEDNIHFSMVRKEKILKWINKDYKDSLKNK